MSGFWRLALSSLALLGGACQAFPDIPSGECGNGVIDEPQEDCDGFPLAKGQQCRARGTVGECHLDCSVRDSVQTPCPTGWGCDSDFICREPTGDFNPPFPSPALDVGAWSLASGDFDGDGRDDVMSKEPLDSIGGTRLEFFYFDQQGALADTRPFPKLVIAPTLQKYPGDERMDVTFSDGPLGVMLGRPDRIWLPETFSSYRIEEATVRVVAIANRRIQGPTPFVPLVGYSAGPDLPAGSGFFVVDVETGKLQERAHLDAGIADLVGDPVSANVFEDKDASPCLEPAFALRGAKHFSVLNVCYVDAKTSQPLYREPFEQTDVALQPPAAIDAPPQYADLNGDGHLDVLLGAGGKVYVSYGDGISLSVAAPYQLSLANPDEIPAEIPMPLATGDITGDGAPDFVFSDHLLLSASTPGSSLPSYFDGFRNRLGAPVTSAQIADFNADGKLDVVTASSGSLNLGFYTGNGTLYFTQSIISTAAPVLGLTVGDLDGDQVNDLALLEGPRVGQSKNTIKVAYGAAFAPLSAPVPVAQVNHVEQLSSFRSDGISSLIICSSDVIAGTPSGALTLLDGTGDRVPFAPFALTEFNSTGSVLDSQAFALAVGNFTAKDRGDVIALAFAPSLIAQSAPPASNLWLLPNIEAPGAYPRLMPDPLDARLSPTKFLDLNSDFIANALGAAADLDGNGLDEAIFAMPAGADRRRCGILTIRAKTVAGDATLAPQEPVLLYEPCTEPQLVPVDVDSDGRVDLVLLNGGPGATDRKLYVLWNDGSGAFSSDSRTLISNPDDSPQQFTILAASERQPLSLVYVTPDAVRRVRALGASREFAAVTTLYDQVVGGTGITAADVDGDHVSDLVLAQSGRMSVLKAQLKVP